MLNIIFAFAIPVVMFVVIPVLINIISPWLGDLHD